MRNISRDRIANGLCELAIDVTSHPLLIVAAVNLAYWHHVVTPVCRLPETARLLHYVAEYSGATLILIWTVRGLFPFEDLSETRSLILDAVERYLLLLGALMILRAYLTM